MGISQIELVSEEQLRYLDQELQDKLIAYELAKEEGEGNEFQALVDLGDLYRRQRSYDKAISYYRQSFSHIDFSLGPSKQVRVLNRLGRVLFANAEYEEALESLEAAENLSEELDNNEEKLLNKKFQALSHAQLGNLNKAINGYYGMYGIARHSLQDTTAMIEIMSTVSELCNLEGNYENVIAFATIVNELEQTCQSGPNVNMSIELAHALAKLKRPKEAIPILERAESFAISEIAFVQKKLAEIHYELGNMKEATAYVDKAIASAELRNNSQLLIDLLEFKAEVLATQKNYKDGIISVKQSAKIKESLQTKQLLDNSRRLRINDYMKNAENQFRQRVLQTELETSDAIQKTLEIGAAKLEKEKLDLERQKKDQELQLAKEQAERDKAERRSAELEVEQAKSALALITQSNLALQQQRANEQLEQQRQTDSLRAASAQQAQLLKNEALEQEKILALNDAKQQEAASKRNMWIAGFMGLGLLTTIGFYINTRRLSRQVESERERAEQLLLNVLPKSIAEELKTKGVAAPEKYESATVLFTDFVGFTSISSSLAPEEIIEELNECFTAFDAIAQRHNLEKIKTIGDSYMCAGGIPDANDTHAADAVKAGQDMVAFMNERNANHQRNGNTLWPIRVGIHTGELVAGVVGSSKFAYDIWGDTVNVASRMERGAEHDSINISEATYHEIKNSFDCQFRGEIDVKNKGKMGMYRVG